MFVVVVVFVLARVLVLLLKQLHLLPPVSCCTLLLLLILLSLLFVPGAAHFHANILVRCSCHSLVPFELVGGTRTRRLALSLSSEGLCGAYSHQSIHAQTRITVLIPTAYGAEHPCPEHNNVRVPRTYGHQSINAQTLITFVSCPKSIQSSEHPYQDHKTDRIPRAYGHQSIHAQARITFVCLEHIVI